MFLFSGTGCLVYLVGNLSSMPVIQKDKTTDMLIIVNRRRYCVDDCRDKVECYRVILNFYDAIRILKFGYLGMTVSIRGDLRVKHKTEIIAEKIDFATFSNASERDVIIHSCDQTVDISQIIYFEKNRLIQNQPSVLH